jgi:uncharacterized SAM-binding protein YcdF (DUF218 family)
MTTAYLASKILPLLVLPIGLTLLLLGLGLLLRRRWPIVLALALLWTASTPLVASTASRFVEGGLVRLPAEAMPVADAIVVLSSERVLAPGPERVSEWSDPDRFFGGLELFRAGRAPYLVFTGGASPRVPDAPLEGDVLAPAAIAAGVPSDAVRTTGSVLNTAEEAIAVATLLTGLPDVEAPPHVLLVTSAYHVPRAVAHFERAGMRVTPFPVDFQVSAGRAFGVLDLMPDARALWRTQRALREMLGRVVAGVR